VGERRLDEAEVGGSIPPAPTTKKKQKSPYPQKYKKFRKNKKIKSNN
jgi:hypothetical protein